MNLAEWLAVTNAVLAFSLAIFALRYVRRVKTPYRIFKIAQAALGFYWGALYTWVAITPSPAADPVAFGQIFVRPAFTFTLALMAAGAIYRWRSND